MRPYDSNDNLRIHLAQVFNLFCNDPKRLHFHYFAEDSLLAVAVTANPSGMVSRVETYSARTATVKPGTVLKNYKLPSQQRYHVGPSKADISSLHDVQGVIGHTIIDQAIRPMETYLRAVGKLANPEGLGQ